MPVDNISKQTSSVQQHSADPEKSEILVDRNADLGLQHLAKNGRVEYTEEEERKVRWKIDLCVLPIVSWNDSSTKAPQVANQSSWHSRLDSNTSTKSPCRMPRFTECEPTLDSSDRITHGQTLCSTLAIWPGSLPETS